MKVTHMKSEDLPEAMLESMEHQEKISLYLPHLIFNHSVTHSRGAMDGSLLASIQVTTHKHNVGTSVLYDTWFKVVLIGCLVMMALTMVIRLILCRHECPRMMSFRTVPSVTGYEQSVEQL